MKRLIFFLIIFVCGLAISSAQSAGFTTEYQIKAGFLYNFAKFVEWAPERSGGDPSTLSICVLGEDPFKGYLRTIEGKLVRDRKLAVKNIEDHFSATGCHMLFVAKSEERRVPEILRSVQGLNVLTVGDFPGFAKRGGIINLITQEDSVRFETNIEAARRAGFAISSELLKLSTIVKE